jgi:hypothetical protein
MRHFTKEHAIALIQDATLGIVRGDPDCSGFTEIVIFHGYEEDSDKYPDLDYMISAEGIDDIYITDEGVYMDDDGTISVPGYNVKMYFYKVLTPNQIDA